MMSGSLESGGDLNYFRYTALYDSYYVFYTTSSIDTCGRLTDEEGILLDSTYDGDGNPLSAFDDDGGVGLNFRITYKLNRGDSVYLKVTGWNDSVTGNYIFKNPLLCRSILGMAIYGYKYKRKHLESVLL